MLATGRRRNYNQGGLVTQNAAKGIPKDNDNLQKNAHGAGRAPAALIWTTQRELPGGYPSKNYTEIQNKRSASESVLPTNNGNSKKDHILHLPKARWRINCIRVREESMFDPRCCPKGGEQNWPQEAGKWMFNPGAPMFMLLRLCWMISKNQCWVRSLNFLSQTSCLQNSPVYCQNYFSFEKYVST